MSHNDVKRITLCIDSHQTPHLGAVLSGSKLFAYKDETYNIPLVITSSLKGNDHSPVLKTLSKNKILTSIKGCNSVANLRKTKIYNNNVELVNDNVFTKFGLILSIPSQDIEQKPHSDVNQGP